MKELLLILEREIKKALKGSRKGFLGLKAIED